MRRIRERVIKEEESRIRLDSAERITAIENEVAGIEARVQKKIDAARRLEADANDLGRRVQDRREDLDRKNEELRNQIRLIEAKASPDNVWVTAFTAGFTKAWDTMSPIMQKGLAEGEASIRRSAIDQVVTGLEPAIEKRLEEAGEAVLKPANLLIAKRLEFIGKRQAAKTDSDKAKYDQYLEVINWVLNGNGIQESNAGVGAGSNPSSD